MKTNRNFKKVSHQKLINKIKRKSLFIWTSLVFVVIGVALLVQSFAYAPNFIYYNQKDPRWAQSPYPYKTGTPTWQQGDIAMARSGCGPTAMAMVASSLTRVVTPIDIASWYGSRYHTPDGTDRAVYPIFAKDYGLAYSSLGYFTNSTNRASIQTYLNTPFALVIIHAGPGMFSSIGHIMVIRDYNSSTGEYLIADPANEFNNRWFKEADLIQRGNLNTAFGFMLASSKNPVPTTNQPSTGKNP